MLHNLTFTRIRATTSYALLSLRFFNEVSFSHCRIQRIALSKIIPPGQEEIFEMTTTIDKSRLVGAKTKRTKRWTIMLSLYEPVCTTSITATSLNRWGSYPTCGGPSVYLMRMMPRSGGRNLGYSYH